MSSCDGKADLHLVRASLAAPVDVAVERSRAVVDGIPVVVAAFAVLLAPERKSLNCQSPSFIIIVPIWPSRPSQHGHLDQTCE